MVLSIFDALLFSFRFGIDFLWRALHIESSGSKAEQPSSPSLQPQFPSGPEPLSPEVLNAAKDCFLEVVNSVHGQQVH